MALSLFIVAYTRMIYTSPRVFRTCATLLAALGVSACSGASSGSWQTVQPVSKVQIDPVAIAKARADSARYPWTAADAHFMSAMIGHHAQAIVMANMAASHGASASVRILAERIVNAQEDEIATAERWLLDRQLPVPKAAPPEMQMTMDGAEHDMTMPGMLRQSQIVQLDKSRGPEFDRSFLTLMIQHHHGAVAMVRQLFGSYGAGQDQTVFKFASDVGVDQTTEIARMERMVAALPQASRSP